MILRFAILLACTMFLLTSPSSTQQTSNPLPSAPAASVHTVVLDAGHGGTDPGAHGASGAIEKDLTLQYAEVARAELQARGYRVVMTRTGDEDPSFDDRAGRANEQRGAIFLSFHVSSTGPEGTVRSYAYPFSASDAYQVKPEPESHGLLPWDRAQEPFSGPSTRLADLLQAEFGRRFAGSPDSSIGAEVRDLRSVALPAVAIEVSSVSAANPKALEQMAPGMAAGVAAAVQKYWLAAASASAPETH
jgi:N-acetylmuramoyl-L-alanine amidase